MYAEKAQAVTWTQKGTVVSTLLMLTEHVGRAPHWQPLHAGAGPVEMNRDAEIRQCSPVV
jgi:hypothetical protein